VGADTGGYLFLPPFPLARDVVIFASRKDGNLQEKDMPVSDFLQPPVLAGITRSVYDLIAEIPRRGEASWSVYDDIVLRFWDRKGPYLFPKMSRENYGEFSGLCLDAGLVISPDYDIPSVVPWQANKGDFSALCSKAT
jgi:hypothetical protein